MRLPSLPSCLKLCTQFLSWLKLALRVRARVVRVRNTMKKVTSSEYNQSEAASCSTDRSDRFSTVTMPEILRDDTAHRRLLETGSELMLQQHLAYNGYLTTSEQTKWKNIITNALADKSFNDASIYLLDKLRELIRAKLIQLLLDNP